MLVKVNSNLKIKFISRQLRPKASDSNVRRNHSVYANSPQPSAL